MSQVISLPFRIDETGGVATEDNPANQLTQKVYSVLGTQPGSRIMRPAYGTDLGQFVWGWGGALQDINGEIQGSDVIDMRDLAKKALAVYEPDAVLDTLRITQMPDDNGVMRIEIHYRPTDAAAAANPAVVVRELAIGQFQDGTFVDLGVNRPPIFFRNDLDVIDTTADDDRFLNYTGIAPDFGDGVTDNSAYTVPTSFDWPTA